MLVIYISALILGGVVLGASMFGGHDHDAGGTDHDLAHDAHHDGENAISHVSKDASDFAATFISTVFSLRFWTFFLTFFGLAGLLYQGLLGFGTVVSAVLSLMTGLGIATFAALIFRWARMTSTSTSATANDYIGKTAEVLVAIPAGGRGKLRLQVKGSSIDLIAESEESEGLRIGEQVLVVSLDGTTAKVVRAIATTKSA